MKINMFFVIKSLNNAFFLAIFVINVQAMEQTPVKMHLDWLHTVHYQAVTDGQDLVRSMCGLSRYFEDYKEYNYLKSNEEALVQLANTKSILERVTTQVVNLSSNSNLSWSLKAHNTLAALSNQESPLSKALDVYKALLPQSLPVGQKLASALHYLNNHCDILKRALEENDAQKSIAAMTTLSYGTQLLFSALHDKETLRKFTLHSICRDEKFLKYVQDIPNSCVPVTKKTSLDVTHQNERERLYAKWLQKNFTNPVATGLKIVEDIASKPDVSGLGYMFLNPSFVVKKALPLVERFAWIRRLLGPLGKDIEVAMNNNMAPTKIMQKAKTIVPVQLKPLLISCFKNYGKSTINPSLWLCNKSLYFMRFLAERSELFTHDLSTYGKTPSFEEQLYPYLSTIGSSFYSTVQTVLKKADHKNPD